MKKSIFFILVCLLHIKSNSQISDSLYQLLPGKLKPADKKHVTSDEKREILKNSGLFPSARPELERLAGSLELENRHASRESRIKNFAALTNHYASPDYLDKILTYTDSSIFLIKEDTAYSKMLAHAYIQKGQALIFINRQEETAGLFNKALSIFQKKNDSVSIGNVHNFQMVLYSSLNLYEQAIAEARLGFAHLYPIVSRDPARKKLSHFLFCNFHFETANAYLNWYEISRKKQYADSLEKHLAVIKNLSYEQAGPWYPYYYFIKGCHAFIDTDYVLAIAYIDSSLSPRFAEIDQRLVLNTTKKIYKGLCLMALGKSTEGRQLVLNNLGDADGFNIDLDAVASERLYLDAQRRGDWKDALQWHTRYWKDEDSMNVIAQRGKVFEVNQKYQVKEREAEIKNLELASLNQAEQKQVFLLATSALVLVLIVIIIGLYGLGRRRKIKALEARQAFENEHRKVEDLIISQDRKVLTEKNRAIAELKQTISRDMHDGLSNALTSLKYYVGSLSLKETGERNKALLKDIELEVNSVYIQARDYMHNLNEDLDKVVQDFGSFLSSLSQQFSDPDGFQVDLRVNVDELKARLNAEQQNEMNMIIKEAITNTMKHAGATKLLLTIDFDEKSCSFNIADNGKGFAVSLTEKGLGLESIKARIRQLKGNMVIESLSSGTSLKGSFPLAA